MPDLQATFDSYLNVRSAYAPSFDSSGKRVAFLMDVTGVPQVWLIDAKGGWPRQLTYYSERVSLVNWRPTGNQLLFAMDEGGSERHQLYLIDLDAGGEVRALTDSPEVMHIFGGWSPDGASVAFASNERHPAHFDVYVMKVPGGTARMVYQNDGSNSVAAWTPDGSGLVISRDVTSRYNDLTYLDLATGEARPLSPDGDVASYGSLSWDYKGKGLYLTTNRDREFSALAWMDAASGELAVMAEPPWDVEAVSLSPDGRRIAYVADEAGYSRLFIRDLESQSEMAVEGLPTGTLQNPRGPAAVEWSPDGATLALTANGVAANANVWLCDVEAGTARQLTFADTGGVDGETFVEPRLVQFPTFDGREIPAFLYAPPGAKADGSNAVIMHVHGGPEGQERPSFNAQYQYFVSRGYCVLAPNVRGSSGYGRTYIHLDDVRQAHGLGARPGVSLDLAEGLRLGRPQPRGGNGRQLRRLHGAGGHYQLSRPVGRGGGAVRHRQLRDFPGKHELLPAQAARVGVRQPGRRRRLSARDFAHSLRGPHNRAAAGIARRDRPTRAHQRDRADSGGPAQPGQSRGIRPVRGRGPRLRQARQQAGGHVGSVRLL